MEEWNNSIDWLTCSLHTFATVFSSISKSAIWFMSFALYSEKRIILRFGLVTWKWGASNVPLNQIHSKTNFKAQPKSITFQNYRIWCANRSICVHRTLYMDMLMSIDRICWDTINNNTTQQTVELSNCALLNEWIVCSNER